MIIHQVTPMLIGMLSVYKQWGYTPGGTVAFPIPFTAFSHVYCQHNGKNYGIAKASTDSPLTTVDIRSNTDGSSDAHWFALGK